ncbi:succinic semialdehyde dehydrogenase [Ganoderma leucocontextum]|nr:succinic semialdehyde dehydrogenase [Ganoderma leucocontextum]
MANAKQQACASLLPSSTSSMERRWTRYATRTPLSSETSIIMSSRQVGRLVGEEGGVGFCPRPNPTNLVPTLGMADLPRATLIAVEQFPTSRHRWYPRQYLASSRNFDNQFRRRGVRKKAPVRGLLERSGRGDVACESLRVSLGRSGRAPTDLPAHLIRSMYAAEEAVRTYGEVVPSAFSNIRNVVVKQPIGAYSILTPWNFPSAMITRKLGAALAAGCTAVVKPPPEGPFSALALVELATRAGVPPGVINVVTTLANVSEVGREMCENAAVRKVSFTGSTPVAKLLYGLAASTLKKVSLEAGGNAPFIVFDDADIDAAIEGVIACKFRGTGQTCVCRNRIYVQSSVYAEFASRLAERVAAFKVGNGLNKDTTHGPLIHERAVEKVQRHIDDAVAQGAQLLVGGKRLPGAGSFFAPTILSDVPAGALVNKEETFGPLAALTRFETEEEVIRLAHDVPVGLAGYFFSRDAGRVWRVAEALEVGMPVVESNTGLISQAVIPFGGVKGGGRERESGRVVFNNLDGGQGAGRPVFNNSDGVFNTPDGG